MISRREGVAGTTWKDPVNDRMSERLTEGPSALAADLPQKGGALRAGIVNRAPLQPRLVGHRLKRFLLCLVRRGGLYIFLLQMVVSLHHRLPGWFRLNDRVLLRS